MKTFGKAPKKGFLLTFIIYKVGSHDAMLIALPQSQFPWNKSSKIASILSVDNGEAVMPHPLVNSNQIPNTKLELKYLPTEEISKFIL